MTQLGLRATLPGMEILLDPDRRGKPVYQQIADHFRHQVGDGVLTEGARLPTIRELAGSLGVNRDTVALAYESLAADGLVEARVGRGTFVRKRRPSPELGVGRYQPRYSPLVGRLVAFERSRPRYGAGVDAVPLHALHPDPSLFPVEPFRRSINRALADGGAELLGYGGPQGHAGLRDVLAERMRSVGILAQADELVLCQGASQGISLALRLFAGNGDAVAVEEPTYNNVIGALLGLGLRAVPVPMTPEGPDLGVLEAVLARPDVRLFYTIPTFHNPMGISTGLDHRRSLLELAARAGKPIVEDAFEMDLRFTGRGVPTLAALDDEGIVVQLFSFSKSLFPGGRVGSVLARHRGVEGLVALKQATDLGGSLPIQAALADFVRCGAYDRHLHRLRRVLRERWAAMEASLRAFMSPEVSWTTPEGGYQVWLNLPRGLDTRDLLADAIRAGVLFAPGDQYQHDGRSSCCLRLTLALADVEGIQRGVEALAGVVRERIEARSGSEAPMQVSL